MAFEVVYVYDSNGTNRGATILQQGANKLHTLNLWDINNPEDATDLREQLGRLVDNTDVRAFWPDVRDPDVQALLDNPQWEPLTLSPVEVMDEENSIIVWEVEPDDTNPYGRMDPDLSVIVNKTIQAPSPAEVKRRTMKACEVVARARANAN